LRVFWNEIVRGEAHDSRWFIQVEIVMTHHFARWSSLLAMTFVIAACHSDNSNTAPTVATTITADPTTNGQTASAGTTLALPVVVHVTDQNNAPISGAVVTWAVVNHAGTLGAATSTTDATGTTNMLWTLDTIARVDSLTATIQSGASVTITARGTAGGSTSMTKQSGDAQTVKSDSTSAPLVIKVTDRYGNAVQGVAVAWVSTGGGALSASATTTDANGMSQVTLTLGATPGPYTVTATAGLTAAATFNLTGN
jgi:protocatechuate 3,4-dioxygenase beta subunit